jgi:hypothetical protein
MKFKKKSSMNGNSIEKDPLDTIETKVKVVERKKNFIV